MAANLTHAQQVTRLYRKSLKHLLSWAVYRHEWRQEALKLRARFDANKDLRDMKKATQLLQDGEREFEIYKHPDPYITPDAPDGTTWERNLPSPPHILEMTPEEQQWYDDYMKHVPVEMRPPKPPFPYPLYVWSPSGGWWCDPPHWKRNTVYAFMWVGVLSAIAWYITAPLEEHPARPAVYPARLIEHAKEDDPRLQNH